MEPDLHEGLARFLATDNAPLITDARRVGGGSIHRTWLLELTGGRRLFVKVNAASARRMFECEAAGLLALARPGILRVPREARVGETSRHAFLVMEAIESGSQAADFFRIFGERFAELHRQTQHPRCGFEHDNFIGSTPQPNPWSSDWVAFWREHRLGFQLRLARENGMSDTVLERLGDRLMDRLDAWLAVDEPFCLLHGDLWSGNFLVDEQGEPVLIDPAVYYGHREADLAMTQLFGGFGPDFYRAYEATWPLPAGSAERLMIYRLYHLLNHLNLFGRGYLGSCVDLLRRLVG